MKLLSSLVNNVSQNLIKFERPWSWSSELKNETGDYLMADALT